MYIKTDFRNRGGREFACGGTLGNTDKGIDIDSSSNTKN